MAKRAKVASRVARLREFMVWFMRVYKPCCWICGEYIDPEAFARGDDGLTLHHINEDRKTNPDGELEIVHRCCHQKLHKGGVDEVYVSRINGDWVEHPYDAAKDPALAQKRMAREVLNQALRMAEGMF